MTLEDLKGLLAKATPGPWRVDLQIENRGESPRVYGISGSTGEQIVETDTGVYPPGLHDAALIAAAPELAALLVRAVEEMRVLVGRCVCEDKDACLVCTPARSLLRELEVEV